MHAFSCAEPRCMRKPWKRQMRTYLIIQAYTSVAVNAVIRVLSGLLSHFARTGAHPFFQCVHNIRQYLHTTVQLSCH